MARLPVPGSDNNTWGDLLNSFLSVEHNTDGTLKASGSLAVKYEKPAGGIPETDLTSAAQTKLNSVANAVEKGSLVVNVKDYGAIGNGTTNDTAAFNAAITAVTASTLSGTVGMVFVPTGTYLIEPLTLPNRVGLRGVGPGNSRLWRRNGGTTTGAFIKNATNARLCSISQLMLDGRGVGNSTSHGLHINNSAALDTDVSNNISEYIDGRHLVADLLIQNCAGDGLHMQGRGVVMVTRVQSWINSGHGFVTGTDSFLTDCDAGSSGLDGFFISGANTRLTSCKAWYSGAVSTAGAGVTGGTGHGFHIADSNYSTCTLTGCEAQDNQRAGFYLNNVGRHIVQGGQADSNNRANLNHAGFEIINSSSNYVSGIGWDRNVNSSHQLAAVRVQNGSANRVEITVSNTTYMAEAYITNDSVIDGNVVRVNSQDGYKVLTYGASITPNPYNGRYQTIPLTGNIAMVTPAYKHAGMALTCIFTQDATGGRTVTWDSGYTLTSPAINPAANATTTLDFIYNGSKWLQVASSYSQPTGLYVARPAVGEYMVPATTGTYDMQMGTLDEVAYIPIDVAVPTQIDALACYVSTVGVGSGMVIRLGLYGDSGTGRPTGSPLVNAGTVDPTVGTGVKLATFTAITLQPGRYWIAGVVQGAITTAPTVTAASMINQTGLALLGNNSHRTWAQWGVSGSLGSVSTIYRAGSNPLLAARVSG